MLRCEQPDPRVEFVASQLKKQNWISGYTFIQGEGYRLAWSPQGKHRMMLLQIALKNSSCEELRPLRTQNTGANAAVQDFWDACLAQLSLSGEEDAVSAFVRIVESWKPGA